MKKEIKIIFLDIGHGDSSVITFSEKGRKACIIVDGGESKKNKERIVEFLEKEEIKAIDLLVATHIDQDHIQGLNYFLDDIIKEKNLRIRYYWGPRPEEGKSFYVNDYESLLEKPGKYTTTKYIIQSVAQNERLYEKVKRLIVDEANIYFPSLEAPPPLDIFENVQLELLGPYRQIPSNEIKAMAFAIPSGPTTDEILTIEDFEMTVEKDFEAMATKAHQNANNQSIVFRLTPKGVFDEFKSWQFLFTGDAEEESWGRMVRDEEINKKLESKVLKVPHHGSRNGITEEGLRFVKPSYSVISVGQKHGLPDKETLSLLKKCNSNIFCTERNEDQRNPVPCSKIKDCPKIGRYGPILFAIDADTGKVKITPGDEWCRVGWG
ncbi:TPA: hypothetical protein DCX16_02185 [bacterium]|nr:hypothetical protein [bacterium]